MKSEKGTNANSTRTITTTIPISILGIFVFSVWALVMMIGVLSGGAIAAPAAPGPTGTYADLDSIADAPNTLELLETYTLHELNDSAYGLTYQEDVMPNRLYVSDYSDHHIYIYEVHSDDLDCVFPETIDTEALDPAFIKPKGLGYAREFGVPTLYALTSNAISDDTRDSRLWRVNLNDLDDVEYIDLTQPAFGIDSKIIHGLTVHEGVAYISYDTSDFSDPDEQVQKGILKLRITRKQKKLFPGFFWTKSHTQKTSTVFTPFGSHFSQKRNKKRSSSFTPAAPKQGVAINWWKKSQEGYAKSVIKHIPHSGRKVKNGDYPRAPSFGLAHMEIDGQEYLWGTSYNKYLYLAQAETGRGIFVGDSPGQKRATGLASGNGSLWVVDRITGVDQILRVSTGYTNDAPVQGGRAIRHIYMELATKSVLPVIDTNLRHHFALAHDTEQRPSQGRDPITTIMSEGATSTVETHHYDPAGDVSARQTYRRVQYSGDLGPFQEVASSAEFDVWSTEYRHYVYPARVNEDDLPDPDYTNNSVSVYDLDDTDAYETFLEAVEDEIISEYGADALSTNPYWRARDILEFILENYRYGNVSNSAAGHYSYQPASIKVGLPFDSTDGNEKMSCSTSTFALSGAMRYQGYPTRWIGTTKQRSGWDKNEDKFFTAEETASDGAYHRWAEIWMGDHYGWQRFDPTPLKTEGDILQASQYTLMTKSAAGVSKKDLVLTIGNGKHDAFFDQKGHVQRYNRQVRYNNPTLWENVVGSKYILWTNATTLTVETPLKLVSTKTTTVQWSTEGRWDLDPTANVSIYLQRYEMEDGEYVIDGSRVLMASGIHHGEESAVIDLSDTDNGHYKYVIVKSNDHETGDRGPLFVIAKKGFASPF